MGGQVSVVNKMAQREAIVTRIIQRETHEILARKGGHIHKVTEAEAAALAPIFVKAADEYGLPLAYFLAVIWQESRFDPQAINPNLDINPDRDPRLTDHGIAQISGRNLVAMKIPFERAYDPAWALNHAAKTYAALREWAEETYPSNDPLSVATLAYNAGRMGAGEVLSGKAPLVRRLQKWAHVQGVMTAYERFSRELGE